MIRIIEHGYKCRMETCCPLCGCRFSYEWEDVLKEGYSHYNDNYTYSYPNYKITCPECGNTFTIFYTYIKDKNSGISGITITNYTKTKEDNND